MQAPLVARNYTLFRHVVSEHTKASQFPTPATIREWPVQAFSSTIIGILNGCLESHRRIDIITNVFRPRYPRYHCALNCIQVNSLEFLGWRIAVSVNKIYITLHDQILVMLFTIKENKREIKKWKRYERSILFHQEIKIKKRIIRHDRHLYIYIISIQCIF